MVTGQTGDQKVPVSTRTRSTTRKKPWVKLFTHKQHNLVQTKRQRCLVWEGNCRSGVALAMRHGLGGLSTEGLNGHRKGDEHPANTSKQHGMLYLT